jgi:hypothetical protein
MTAPIPRRAAWKATARPWFPALAAATPCDTSAGSSCNNRFAAPRSLKEPVIWRFSSLTKQRTLLSSESVWE